MTTVNVSRHYMKYDFYLNSAERIRVLLMARSEFALDSGNKKYYHTIESVKSSGEIEEELEIYDALDILVKQCKFNQERLTIIDLIQEGYTLREISKRTGIDSSNVSKKLTTICKAISKQYKLSKIIELARQENKYFKRCSKCKERLPCLPEFYSYDNSKGSFKSYCKRCRKR